MDNTLLTVAQRDLDAVFAPPPVEHHQRRSVAASLPHLHHDRVHAPELRTHLAVKPRRTYVNLPPAIDVETVEEARAMLHRWEEWNLHLEQQLRYGCTSPAPRPLPVNKTGDQVSAIVADSFASSQACYQRSTHALACDDDTLCKQFKGGFSYLYTELTTELGAATRSVKASMHPFSVASRTTVATTQRKVQSKSTRRSRALLLKRALELVGKPLGRAGSGTYSDIDVSHQLSLARQTLEGCCGNELPIHSGDFLTETETLEISKVEKTATAHDPIAVVGRLKHRLREEPWLSTAYSLAHLKESNCGSEKSKDKTQAWPRPPLRLHRKLNEHEETAKSIPLVNLSSVSVPSQGNMEEEDGPPILLTLDHDSSADIMTQGEVEGAQQSPVKRESFSDDSCSDDAPSRGFPIVLLTNSAVCILPALPAVLNGVKSEGGDTVAYLAHEVSEAMEIPENMDMKAEEVADTIEPFGSPVARAQQSADLSETGSMTVDDEEDRITTSNSAILAAKEEQSEGDSQAAVEEDEGRNMLLANNQSPTASERALRGLSEAEKPTTFSGCMHHGFTTFFGEICAIQELKAEEYTFRMALVIEESLQLCELCFACHSEVMNAATERHGYFGPNILNEKWDVAASPSGNTTVWRDRNEVETLMLEQRQLERSRCGPRAFRSVFRHWGLKRRRRRIGFRCLTALEVDCGDIENRLHSEALKARLSEAISALQETREAAAKDFLCAKEKYAALERAANIRLTKLQGDVLKSTATEHQALKLAAALERSLLLAKCRAEEHTAKTRLIALELCDLEEGLARARAQTAAAVAVLGRYAFVSLVQRCYCRWTRKCRETKCRALERVRRESIERRQELMLWHDHVCFAITRCPVTSVNATSETAAMPLIAAMGASAKNIAVASAPAIEASEPVVQADCTSVLRS
ncbi:hypothetical protein TraAM80_04369 [Trypanosoma rangeli]|uniref:Uncharacterized protein n=1 Tax=Trypanosoma rangeli TaxID=5698 RepID=A0A3R7LYE0_TRYRA|nr:uncharacterized protein TraAM80_04369 [Trypanosoma rangeli]RNF05745.1 hypothetical protein TraAM80_04369 [Trypanosoma rangeli]|eukprot:RNF05745.1 hypothetical protein TraAM80_04369 [Trypanosoma rangeli]